MMETKLLGPKDDQWAVISLGSQWLATTRAVYADAVKAAPRIHQKVLQVAAMTDGNA